ncbi:MAG TPA: VWA domain-containing protein [Chloroflexia bacterium]|nr:VWA domain-containing protein [Chloroflexia bacterium]
MTWLAPGAAVWLLLLPALIGLYLLRARPERHTVSSLRLWQLVPAPDRGRRRVRPPPRSLLLLLQLLLLGAGALALLQPARTAPAGRHTILLLDASGSMQAREGTATRFAAAQVAARRLATAMGRDDRATLLRVGPAVTTLCTACPAADLTRSLDGAAPGAGRADWDAAFRLAGALAEPDGDTVVLSDGGFAPVAADALPAAVRFITVGTAQDNRAVTTLSARRLPDGHPGSSAYARVDNFAGSPATLTVTATVDATELPARSVTLPPGGHADLVWPLPAGAARLTVGVQPPDALPLDDIAAVLLPTVTHTVCLMAPVPDLYAHALAGLANVETVAAGAGRPCSGDLTIVEGALPDPLPAGGLLLVAPTGSLLPASGTFGDAQALGGAGAHPLLAGIDLQALLVARATRLEPVAWLEPLVTTAGGALLLAGEQAGRRVAVLPFDPRESNLPKLAAFPVLLANLVDWLDPLATTGALRAGEAVALPPGATVRDPAGHARLVDVAGLFAATELPGRYTVQRADSPERAFIVNMTDAQESDLAPQAHPELDRPVPAAATRLVTQEVFWPPLVAAALACLGIEWLLFCWKRGRA